MDEGSRTARFSTSLGALLVVACVGEGAGAGGAPPLEDGAAGSGVLAGQGGPELAAASGAGESMSTRPGGSADAPADPAAAPAGPFAVGEGGGAGGELSRPVGASVPAGGGGGYPAAGWAGEGGAALADASGGSSLTGGAPSTGDTGLVGASATAPIRCALLAASTPPADGCSVAVGTGPALLLVADLLTPELVFESGQLLIDGEGWIRCVGCDCAELEPSATRLTCADTVAAPGLVNAHDHGAWMNGAPFDADDFVDRSGAPLAADPRTRFIHRHDWRTGGNAHLPKIEPPGGSASLAAKTWGELRFALGGATTSFASTRLTGILRDIDDSAFTDERTRNLPGHAYATYETFPLGSSAQAERGCGAYTLRRPSRSAPWIPHVAEGIDVSARNEFLCLTGLVPGGFSVLDGRTALIHATALLARDMAHMAALGAKVVWSPRSNLSLYGDTARVVTMDRLGLTLGLGTDWLPTGSMNLLRELACADGFNRDYLDGHFSDAALVAMATAGSAEALGFADVLGRLAADRVGDVVLFARRGRAPYRAVIEADEGDVRLVLRGGSPTVGDAALVAALEPDCEELGEVCGVSKRACVERDTGQTLAAVAAAVGPSAYPLFGCGAPPGEVTCIPSRALHEDALALGSTPYVGVSSADDLDGDGIPNADDLCPRAFGPIRPVDLGAQADADGDGLGDDCDPCPLAPGTMDCAVDTDGDGVPDPEDLCPFDAGSALEDRDGDGWGDACDACPDAPNPGAAVCPGPEITIAELWELGDGIDATLEGVCVIAAKPPRRLWLQDPPAVGPEGRGIFVYSATESLRAAVGDRVRVSGQTTTYEGAFELALPTVTLLASDDPGCSMEALVRPVTVADVVPGSPSELLHRYRLVRLADVQVTTAGEGSAPFMIDAGLRVSSYVAGFDPAAYPVGTRFAELVGVVDYFDGNQLLPRAATDLRLE